MRYTDSDIYLRKLLIEIISKSIRFKYEIYFYMIIARQYLYRVVGLNN